MNKILVIQEKDLSDMEISVIGVAGNEIDALIMVNKYYGEHKLLEEFDVYEYSQMCFSKELEVLDHKYEPYRVYVWAEWFYLNEI